MAATALSNFDSLMWWVASLTGRLLNGTNHAIGGAFVAPAAKAITHVVIPCSAISSPDAFTVRLESLSSGLPTGTVLGSTSTSWTPVVGCTEVQLASSYTPAAGEAFAATIKYGTTGSATIIGNAANSAAPYTVRDATGAGWAIATSPPGIGVKFTDGTYFAGTGMCHLLGTVAITNASATLEAGLASTAPTAITISGVFGYYSDASKAHSVLVYLDESTTPTAIATIAAGTLTQSTSVNYFSVMFASPVSVAAGQKYRIVIRSDSASTMTIYRRVWASTAIRDAVVGANYYTTRAGGAWTDTTTATPHLAPIIATNTASGGYSRGRLI